MKGFSGHTSYYINVGQTLGIIGGLILGFRALKLEEAKAGLQHRSLKETVIDDVRRVKNWYQDNFGAYRQYPHY